MSIASQLRTLAVPNIISNLSTPFISLVDSFVAGHLEDPEALASIAIGVSCFLLLYNLFIFLRKGTTGLCAQAYGKKDLVEIKCVGIRSICLGLVIGLLLFIFRESLVANLILKYWIKPPSSSVSEKAKSYIYARLLGAPFALSNYAVFALLNGMKRPRDVLVLQLMLNFGNACLCLFFAWILDLGLPGIGYAAAVANCAAFCVGLRFVIDAVKELEKECYIENGGEIVLSQKITLSQVLDITQLTRMLELSLSITARSLCLMLVLTSFTGLQARIGTDEHPILAGNLLLLQLHDLISTGTDGFSNAAEVLVGESIGQRNEERLKAVIKESVKVGFFVALTYSLIYAVFGNMFFAAMSTDAKIIEEAHNFLIWLIVGPFLAVWAFLFDGFFVGATLAKEMMLGMILASLGYLVTLGGCYLYFKDKDDSTNESSNDSETENNGLWFCFYSFQLYRAMALLIFFPALLGKAGKEKRLDSSDITGQDDDKIDINKIREGTGTITDGLKKPLLSS